MANVLKRQAKEHATFKELCIGLAQKMHVADVVLRSKLTPTKFSQTIRPLNESRAVESGATILSEAFVFGVTGTVVVWETLRQRQKELDRRDQVTQDIAFLQSEIEELRAAIDKQKNQSQLLSDLQHELKLINFRLSSGK
ncbi:unnamed protein product [Kluyveromyces dobzhanskii CBS 2104]|uniref:WGS project CCBQ000000000 data, contig 00099 n=1 Tax=Kluyveromyces dobzhanskii CBS 2104 TaxID=1427455 RepID=A0A0A8L263_9SACH|nr:unnamed protein product [Kluyveromyces dobzhanskii CBS 2104]